MRWFLALAALVLATVTLAQPRPTVRVSAAASLTEALDAVARKYEQQAGSRVLTTYAASPALARQIENGAPADIFISADSEWMDYLSNRQAIDQASRRNLVGNRLVLIAPAGAALQLKSLTAPLLIQALGNGRLAMADPQTVPAGRYGKAALTWLGAWPQVAPRVIPAEHVRAALTYVARGEAPLGIVYRTDALAEKRVRIVAEFPAQSHGPIAYPAALTARASPAGGAFFEWLVAPEARAIFKAHGFD